MSSTRTPMQPSRNRRMTLSTLPSHQKQTASSNRRSSIDPSSNSNIPTGPKRPPKARQSMIPRMGGGGRENFPPTIPSTPSGHASVSSTAGSAASSRRRTSLGGDSLSHHNQRMSLVPPPAAAPPVPSNRHTTTDPRPIHDKNYQQQCIRNLMQFLLDSGYEFPISSKSLTRPSAKDFTNIVTFMLRLIDRDFGRGGTMKFEDEVALNFKCLGYPLTISKTSIVAAGSPHTWPTLLAALTWLMEQIQIQNARIQVNELENPSSTFDSLHELEDKTDKAFFQYLGQAYRAFMQGDAAATEKLEVELQQKFERDDNHLHQSVERITDLNATILERIDEIMQQTQDLPLYAKKREDYHAEVEQFKDLIRQMIEHKSTLEQKIKDRTTQLAETNVKLDKMTTHIDNMKQAIKEQEFSVDDIRRMEVEIKGLSEAKDRAMVIKEQQMKMKMAAEEEFRTTTDLLLSRMNTYNQKISTLQIVPELHSKLSSFKATLQIDRILDDDPNALFGLHLTRTVQPVAKTCINDFTAKQLKAEEAHNDLLDELTRTEGLCMETEALLKIAEEKNCQSVQALETERKSHEAKTSIRKREVEGMENKVESLHNPVSLEEQMAAYHRQCADLEALRMEHHDENVAKREAVLEQINSACQLMADHDAFFRHSVANVKQYWQQKTSEIGKVVVPSNIDSTEDA